MATLMVLRPFLVYLDNLKQVERFKILYDFSLLLRTKLETFSGQPPAIRTESCLIQFGPSLHLRLNVYILRGYYRSYCIYWHHIDAIERVIG